MNAEECDSPAVKPDPGLQRFPCTPTQERSWFVSQFRPEDASFTIAVLWEIKGRFDASAFEEAFRVIIERHEILRTKFVEVDGEPMQEVMEKAPFNLAIIDLGILPPGSRRDRAAAICERDSKVPFDLSAPPLLRATLIRLDEDSALLLIISHPSVFDGWSIGVLGRELGQIVSALRANRPHALPPLELQYGDYALWHREYMARGGVEEDSRYWQQQLKNLPYFELSPDRPRPPNKSFNTGVLVRSLDVGLGERLEEAAKGLGVSFFALGCAIIAAMLHGYTQQSDIAIGTQIAGRNDVDLEPLIGAFVNNVVLRFDAADGQLFSQFVSAVAETIRDALVHQQMPFDRLVRLLNPRRDMSRMPLYSINVILQPAFMEDTDYGDFSLLSAPSPSVGTLTDLNFHMIKRPNGWRMTLEYNADIYDRWTIETLFERWLDAIKTAVSDSPVTLSAFARTLEGGKTIAATEAGAGQPDSNHAAPTQAAGRSPDGIHAARSREQLDISDIERKLVGIWRNILRLEHITGDSNFFDAGGHSLSAMRMMSRATAAFGFKPEPARFFQEPTLAALARQILELSCAATGPEADDTWRVVAIQPHGSQPPLTAINGATVYRNFYGNVASKIGSDYPLFSVQPFDPGIASALGNLSMEEIASRYLELARAVNPTGPYVLMGHCAFGIIAFEAARQLRKEGKTVRAVVMFDSWAPGHLRSLRWRHRAIIRLLSRIQVHRNRAQRLFKREMTAAEFLGSINSVRKLRHAFARMGLSRPRPHVLPDEDWFLVDAVRARDDYRLSEYDGDVLLLLSNDIPRGRFFDPYLGWRKAVKGRLSVAWVGGTHMTMGYGSRALQIAEHLRNFLVGR